MSLPAISAGQTHSCHSTCILARHMRQPFKDDMVPKIDVIVRSGRTVLRCVLQGIAGLNLPFASFFRDRVRQHSPNTSPPIISQLHVASHVLRYIAEHLHAPLIACMMRFSCSGVQPATTIMWAPHLTPATRSSIASFRQYRLTQQHGCM
jgi:hypothetical protein